MRATLIPDMHTFACTQQQIDRTFIVNALKLELSTEKLNFVPNEPVIIKYAYTNTSKVALDLPTEPFVWTVRREDGKPVVETPEGRRRKAPRGADTVVVSPAVGAGASLTHEETLSGLYVMNEPGAYFIRVEVAVPDGKGTAFIKSNMLRITIK